MSKYHFNERPPRELQSARGRPRCGKTVQPELPQAISALLARRDTNIQEAVAGCCEFQRVRRGRALRRRERPVFQFYNKRARGYIRAKSMTQAKQQRLVLPNYL